MDVALSSATRPTVAVKVIDKRHNAIYTWSLDRLQQQLQRMRNLTSFIDRPSISRHFSSSEPFYDTLPSTYSFIGNSLVSLAPLARKMSSTSTLPIFCRYTAEAIGSCRVDIKVATPLPVGSSPRGSAPSTRSSSPMPAGKSIGAFKLTFFVTVDNIKGLSSIDFASLHCQIRLSSFAGPRSSPTKAGPSKVAPEEVYVSNALDMDQSSLSDLKLRHTFSLMVTSKVAAYLREGYAPVEFFAVVRPTYLERLERWDEMREQRMAPLRPADGEAPPPQLPPMRRSETDFVVEQVHDAVAWLQICELGSDGAYAPVPVLSSGPLDPGSFCLHQGLQRQLMITLASNSGRQLPWVSVARVKLGNVRLLDQKGQVHESQARELVELKLSKQQSNAEFKADGTGTLSVEALWDSGVHDSLLLNRVTPANQRVLLTLVWYVEVECCAEPVQFTMDVAATVMTRDARPPTNFLTFLGTSKVLSKTSTVFSLRLTPPLTRSSRELWRLDTSEKYVRGEDVLGTWKPRGLSVVDDFTRLESQARRSADVQAIKAILAASNLSSQRKSQKERDEEVLLQKSLKLWQRKSGHSSNVSVHIVLAPVFSQLTPYLKIILNQENEMVSSSASSLLSSPSSRTLKVETEPLKLVGHAKITRRRCVH